MKQVVENMKTGTVDLVEVPVPRCGPQDLLVRTVSSLISAGTEKLMIETGKKSLAGKALARPDLVTLALQKAKREGFFSVFREAMARLDEPVPLGYSSAGIVLEIGSKVKGFAVGDSVACAGAGFASHAEIVRVPQDLCVKLPKAGKRRRALSYDEASFVMLGGIALHGFRTAKLSFGESVVVVGLGLIGLLTVQIARAYGCRVFAVDIDPEKVKLAQQFGAERALCIGKDDVDSAVLNATHGEGADAVVLTAATKDNSPILLAERIARRRATIVLVGVSDITLTRKAFWEKELVFTVSRAAGPGSEKRGDSLSLPIDAVRWTESRNLQEFIRLLATDAVNVESLITHRYPIHHVKDAYEMILKGRERYIGVLLTYPQQEERSSVIHLDGRTLQPETHREPSRVRRTIGVIGAGLFTKSVLLPAIRKIDAVTFRGIATSTGLSAQHVGRRFGFSYATSDYRSLLSDEAIGSVMITTRHNTHAQLVLEALKAGKHVFVEKPLCITREELDRLTKEVPSLLQSQMFLIGFNRRYSSLSQQLKEFLTGRTAPLQAHIRVNAGFVPPDHWANNPSVGGGRIIGEVCHFVDYLQFLVGSDPVEVHAMSIHGETGRFLEQDNVALSVSFADGSLGTITYTALGSKAFSRERVEVFSDETVAVLEDFRKLELVRGARRRTKRLWNQDKGFRQEVETFLSADPERGREIFREAVLTTLTTFAAVESLRRRKPVLVERVAG
jgi:predicted dehydrogenase/threonine dehydrogenase-like Zn-dependent dehydrogenase